MPANRKSSFRRLPGTRAFNLIFQSRGKSTFPKRALIQDRLFREICSDPRAEGGAVSLRGQARSKLPANEPSPAWPPPTNHSPARPAPTVNKTHRGHGRSNTPKVRKSAPGQSVAGFLRLRRGGRRHRESGGLLPGSRRRLQWHCRASLRVAGRPRAGLRR